MHYIIFYPLIILKVYLPNNKINIFDNGTCTYGRDVRINSALEYNKRKKKKVYPYKLYELFLSTYYYMKTAIIV